MYVYCILYVCLPSILFPSVCVCVCLQLFDIIFREETLQNVIMSTTRNSRSILLTAVLCSILVYVFTIVAFSFFDNDLLREDEPLCNTFLMCFIAVLKEGVRSGGGIGDVMRKLPTSVS